MVMAGKLEPAPTVVERVAVRVLELKVQPFPLIEVIVIPAGSWLLTVTALDPLLVPAPTLETTIVNCPLPP